MGWSAPPVLQGGNVGVVNVDGTQIATTNANVQVVANGASTAAGVFSVTVDGQAVTITEGSGDTTPLPAGLTAENFSQVIVSGMLEESAGFGVGYVEAFADNVKVTAIGPGKFCLAVPAASPAPTLTLNILGSAVVDQMTVVLAAQPAVAVAGQALAGTVTATADGPPLYSATSTGAVTPPAGGSTTFIPYPSGAGAASPNCRLGPVCFSNGGAAGMVMTLADANNDAFVHLYVPANSTVVVPAGHVVAPPVTVASATAGETCPVSTSYLYGTDPGP